MKTKMLKKAIGFHLILMICLFHCPKTQAQNYLEQYQVYVDFIQENPDIEQKIESITYIKKDGEWVKEDQSYSLSAQYRGNIYTEGNNSKVWKADGIWLMLDVDEKEANLSFYETKDDKLLKEMRAEEMQAWQNPYLKKALDSAVVFLRADQNTNFYQIEEAVIGFDKKTNMFNYLSQILDTDNSQYKIEMLFKIRKIDQQDWQVYPSYLQVIQQGGKKKWVLTPSYSHYTLFINQN